MGHIYTQKNFEDVYQLLNYELSNPDRKKNKKKNKGSCSEKTKIPDLFYLNWMLLSF